MRNFTVRCSLPDQDGWFEHIDADEFAVIESDKGQTLYFYKYTGEETVHSWGVTKYKQESSAFTHGTWNFVRENPPYPEEVEERDKT